MLSSIGYQTSCVKCSVGMAALALIRQLFQVQADLGITIRSGVSILILSIG